MKLLEIVLKENKIFLRNHSRKFFSVIKNIFPRIKFSKLFRKNLPNSIIWRISSVNNETNLQLLKCFEEFPEEIVLRKSPPIIIRLRDCVKIP